MGRLGDVEGHEAADGGTITLADAFEFGRPCCAPVRRPRSSSLSTFVIRAVSSMTIMTHPSRNVQVIDAALMAPLHFTFQENCLRLRSATVLLRSRSCGDEWRIATMPLEATCKFSRAPSSVPPMAAIVSSNYRWELCDLRRAVGGRHGARGRYPVVMATSSSPHAETQPERPRTVHYVQFRIALGSLSDKGPYDWVRRQSD